MKIVFDNRFFQKKRFDFKIIQKFFRGALKDFKLAFGSREAEIIFVFSYSALIKVGITLIALCGYKIKSRTGHHIKILEKLSQILQNKDIEIIGDKMRKKRNIDLYEGGIIVSLKEAREYLGFVKEIIDKTEKYLKSQNSLF